MFGVAAAVTDDPRHVAAVRVCPYHVPTREGGLPVCTSRIAKHVPLFDILAAAQIVDVAAVTLTRGSAVVETVAAAANVSEGSSWGRPAGHGTVAR